MVELPPRNAARGAKSPVCAALVAMLWLSGAAAAADELTAGVWCGRCELDSGPVFLKLRLKGPTGRLAGTGFIRSLGILPTPVTTLATEGDRASLSLQLPDGPVQLSGAVTAGTFAGEIGDGSGKGQFVLRKRSDLDAAGFQPFAGNYQFSPDHAILIARWDSADYLFLAEGERRIEVVPVGPHEFLTDDLRTINFEVGADGAVTSALVSRQGELPERAEHVRLYDEERVSFTSGDVRLAGSLVVPLGPGPHPALVFVHGSGPQTRESFCLEADRFARNGVACLFFDKRGVGESTGDWRQVDFDVLADDVLAGVRFMRSQPRIRADKVGLWGISQAAWVIPLAASRSTDVAFIVPVSGGAVSPAQQEAWRRRQNLLFLGVPERFIEVGRKASVLAFDWHRRHQVGSMPLPNPFADDQLNMYYDAPAVLRKVSQPALAVFGSLDTLTPPRESAAIWADALRSSGNRDFSVRMFVPGTHGIYVGEKTGSPLEVLREPQYVPGYFATMLAWIHHHAGGPEFAAANQVDTEGDTIPSESRGMDQLSWYGSGAVQPWLLLGSLLVFGFAALCLPLAWLWRRVRRREDIRPAEARRAMRWSAALGILNVSIVCALLYVLYAIADANPHPVLRHVAASWNGLVAATWLSLAMSAVVIRECITAWNRGWWSRTGRAYFSLITVSAICWMSFVFYWDLLTPAW